ncbi:hypothetical protein [Cellulosimicrobium funkei]|uniref:hypothetical protein n=1 Tax=Cellulosimicrobium funkei TaxID=264251 RepID=UPI0036770750
MSATVTISCECGASTTGTVDETLAWNKAHDATCPLAVRSSVVDDVAAERVRQDAKWGVQNHPDGTGRAVRVLDPLVDPSRYTEAGWLATRAKASTDTAARGGSVTWRHILLEEVFEALAEDDPERLRTELVQVAAVAQQWAEAIDRRQP